MRKSGKNMGLSCASYHFCLASMLEGWKEITRDGFVTHVRLGNMVQKVRMICPVMMILNDNKSGDTLACRYSSYNKGTGGISRRCYTSYEKCDDPLHVCEWRDSNLANIYVRMLSKPASAEGPPSALERERMLKFLKTNSTYRVKNALHEAEVWFGDNKRGVPGATPGDFMHIFDSGVIKYILKCALDPVSTTQKAALDKLVDDLFCCKRSCLRKNYPRCNFSKGFTNLTRLTSDEWPGCLFMLALVCSTKAGRDILN